MDKQAKDHLRRWWLDKEGRRAFQQYLLELRRQKLEDLAQCPPDQDKVIRLQTECSLLNDWSNENMTDRIKTYTGDK